MLQRGIVFGSMKKNIGIEIMLYSNSFTVERKTDMICNGIRAEKINRKIRIETINRN